MAGMDLIWNGMKVYKFFDLRPTTVSRIIVELPVWSGSLAAGPDGGRDEAATMARLPSTVLPSSGCFLGAITQIIGRSLATQQCHSVRIGKLRQVVR